MKNFSILHSTFFIPVEASGRRKVKSDILEGPREEFRAAVSVV